MLSCVLSEQVAKELGGGEGLDEMWLSKPIVCNGMVFAKTIGNDFQVWAKSLKVQLCDHRTRQMAVNAAWSQGGIHQNRVVTLFFSGRL